MRQVETRLKAVQSIWRQKLEDLRAAKRAAAQGLTEPAPPPLVRDDLTAGPDGDIDDEIDFSADEKA
jgi:hypothetical protein